MSQPQSPQEIDGKTAQRARHDSSHHATVYQTTGPDAYTGPILSPNSSTPILNPRSCVTCRRRKVRCDKEMPCSNCRRALIPCVYPAPGRAPRQQKPRDPNAPPKSSSQREAELLKRLRKLEGIVEELSGQIEVEPGSGNNSTASPTAQQTVFNVSQKDSRDGFNAVPRSSSSPQAYSPRRDSSSTEAPKKTEVSQRFGRMVLDDQSKSSRYVSSGFWAKMNDELDAIRTETQKLTDDEDDLSDWEESKTDTPVTGTITNADHHSFLLGYQSADVDLTKRHPLPAHSTFLWSVYQENIEPFLKMIHVPTMDSIMREARRSPEKLSPGNQALIFVIYLAAIVALEPEETQTNIGMDRDELLMQYRFAVEQSLAKANYLDTPDLATVQAFTLFLIIIKRHDDSRFCWSLTSLVIRIAQGIGLHRDGSHFGLSVFETEMRRRVWWNLVTLDLRSAEELGTDVVVSERASDTLIPSNINDADISPESSEMPEPRVGLSETSVALMRFETCATGRRLHIASSAMISMCPKADMSAEEKEKMIADTYEKMQDTLLKHIVHNSDPLYIVTAIIARVIRAKSLLIVYHDVLFPGSNTQLDDEARERLFVAAIEIVECNHQLGSDPRFKPYQWLFKAYQSWNALAYLLLESCRRPWSAVVERAWIATNESDVSPVALSQKAGAAAVFLPLRRLFARARKHRCAELERLRANQEDALRLDFAERMSPAFSHFGYIAGAEVRREVIREKWRRLIWPDGSMPTPLPASFAASAAPSTLPFNSIGNRTLGEFDPGMQDILIPSQPHTQESQMTGAMDYVEGLMAKGQIAANDIYSMYQFPTATGQPHDIHPHSAGTPSQRSPALTQNELRRQALIMGTQPAQDDNSPPYLWADAFTSLNTKLDVEPALDDTDMLGDDFNWQDWSRSVRGLEMDGMQTPFAPTFATPQGW